MNLPNPPAAYDQRNEAEARRALAEEDFRNRKKDEDIELGNTRIIIKSPDGTRWLLEMSDAGVLSGTAL